METNTVKAIKDLIPLIEESLDVYQLHYKSNGTDMDAYTWGSEKEYNMKGIIAGVKNILTDIKFLTNAHNLFIKLSTYSNRSNIKSHLSNLNSYLKNKQVPSVVAELDWLKEHLRTYCLRIDKNRYLEFNVAIDELHRKAILLEDEIKIVQEKILKANDTYSKIESTQEKYNEIISDISTQKDTFIEKLNDFTNEFSDFKYLAQRARENEEKITNDLEAAKDNLNEFKAFINIIDDRKKALIKQAEDTAYYEDKLQKYTEEHNKKLSEATRLIEEAKKALNYKNAEGLSAAFSHQLKSASNPLITAGWLLGAGIFIAATLCIGIWIVLGLGMKDNISQNQLIINLIGRLSMIPFTIMGAIFCANQYTTQKNIIEDYAYKTAITKSIIAFSEELRSKDPDQYAKYISTILKEIHQDPLRKRGKDKNDFNLDKDTKGIIEKIITLLQSTITK